MTPPRAISPLPVPAPSAGQACLAKEIAPLSVDVLIEGETGTGKDVMARDIHRHSGRNGKFIAINCAAVPENIAESELFGYETGAFTGAAKAKEGKLELANDGTLYLDEIDSMPLTIQAKLLRALQERGTERLGGSRFYPSDFRVIASTKIALLTLVEQGSFRKDLYYRLNVVKLRLAALRDSREKVLPLFAEFLGDACRRHARALPGISGGTQKLLMEYPWPGNIRELKNAAERFAIGLAPLEDDVQGDAAIAPIADAPPRAYDDIGLSLRERVRNFEHDVIVATLARHEQGVAKAALELQISANTLYYRIKTLGIRIVAASPANQQRANASEPDTTPVPDLAVAPAMVPDIMREPLKLRFAATFGHLVQVHPSGSQHLIFPEHEFLGAMLDALAHAGPCQAGVAYAALPEHWVDGMVAAVREASEQFCADLRRPGDDFLQNMLNSQAADRHAKMAERVLQNFRPRIGDTAGHFDELARAAPCSDIGRGHLWRLCIDPLKLDAMRAKGLEIDDNPYIGHLFDSEPSYLYKMSRAWLYAMHELEREVDLAMILHLHALCSGDTGNAASNDARPQPGLAPASQAWAQFVMLPGETISVDGEEELAQFIRASTDDATAPGALRFSLSAKRVSSGAEFKIFKREAVLPAVMVAVMTRWLGEYRAALAASDAPQSRVGAVVDLCQKLQRLRPFPIGNCRTFGILLMNRLLAQLGQPLTMLDNPNKLDGFSRAEVLTLVYQGQRSVRRWGRAAGGE